LANCIKLFRGKRHDPSQETQQANGYANSLRCEESQASGTAKHVPDSPADLVVHSPTRLAICVGKYEAGPTSEASDFFAKTMDGVFL
jgi:hypothetical protein